MTTTALPIRLEICGPDIRKPHKVLEFTIGGTVGFSGLKVWVNEGVQCKQHMFPWDDVAEIHRPGGEGWGSVITVNGVQFYKHDGTLVWFPAQSITRVEATNVN